MNRHTKKSKEWIVALLAAITFVGITSSYTTSQPGKVKVEGGWIQGTVENDLIVFKGIPFAAPPVGELRWRAPQPVKKWDNVKQTTTFAPAPMQ